MKKQAIASAAVLLLAAAVLAEDIWVKNPVVLREGPNTRYPAVAELKKSDVLTIVSREKGGWLKVQYGDKTGYIHQNSISEKKVSKGIDMSGASAMGADVDTAGAAKGLDKMTIEYDDAKGMSTEPFNKMVEYSKSITAQELESFMAEGKVGSDKP